jgi:uncharacterized protein YjdB
MPSKAYTTFTWSSSSASVASVSSGIVKALKVGTAKITVKTKNGKTASVSVKVVDPFAPTSVALNFTGTKTLYIGSLLFLKPSLQPSTAATSYTWSESSKGKIVSVSGGIVRPIKAGTATVTVKTANGKSASVKVQVVDPKVATSVKFNLTGTQTLPQGGALVLSPVLTPYTAAATFKWSSSNTKVATVDKDGYVYAKGKGTATITVKTNNGKSATVKISVVAQ